MNMRIGIDMRMAGTGEGIGRYSEELVRHIAEIDLENEYFLICHERANPNFKIQNPKFNFVVVKSGYYSWQEQTKLIWELKKMKLDLMHFTNFNVPVFYPGKFIVTIHDIIHHQFPGKKKSRFFHRLAYRWVISSAIERAQKIIAVSRSTKQDIVKTFKINPAKIEVIYEGIDEKFLERLPQEKIEQVKQKYQITKPYLLFVGVWRQYKNLPRLALAFDRLKAEGLDLELVLAGKIDPFYPKIKKQVMAIKNQADVLPLGYVPDDDLRALYQGASLFVLPSLMEGFGLIGAEAQSAGTPVAASDILVLREVLGDGALYFNPNDEQDMANKINKILSDNNLRDELIKKGKDNASKYNWQYMAKQTLYLYS